MAPSNVVPDQAGHVTTKEAVMCGEKAVGTPTKRMATPEAAIVTSPAGVTTATTGSACSGCSSCRVTRNVSRLGGDMIEEFDPKDRDCNIDRWLSGIDRLGGIHGWSMEERIILMQTKLRGTARWWFNNLDNFDRSWAEWKVELKRGFPKRNDFGELLKELTARRK